MINGTQIKMARAALNWGVRDLAEKAAVSANTVSRLEGGENANTGTLKKIQDALEAAGVTFSAEGCVCPPKAG